VEALNLVGQVHSFILDYLSKVVSCCLATAFDWSFYFLLYDF